MAQSLDRDRNTLSYDARPFYPRDSANADDRNADFEPLPPSKQALGERLFPRVYALQPVKPAFDLYCDISFVVQRENSVLTHSPEFTN